MKEGRCPSEMLRRMLPLIMSGLKQLVKILSMRVCLSLEFNFVGREIEGSK